MAGIEYSLAHDSREYLFRSAPLEAWDAFCSSRPYKRLTLEIRPEQAAFPFPDTIDLQETLLLHDLRHTFVTGKVREGWDYKWIMTITGHKTFTVFQRYNNLSGAVLQEVVANTPPPWQDRPVGKLLANGRTANSKTLLST